MEKMEMIIFILVLLLALLQTSAAWPVSHVSSYDDHHYAISCSHTFDEDCPPVGSALECSKLITNCTSPDNSYHCLMTTAGKVVHACAEVKKCPKGTVPIFDPNTRTISCEKCPIGFYQPLQVWSNSTPACKKKFVCDSNLHQIECPVESKNEHTQDTLCRCDVRKGYALSASEKTKTCVSGKYAKCYEMKCSDGQEMLQNYTCAPRCKEGFEHDDSDICVPKSTDFTTKAGEKALPTSTENSNSTVNIVLSVSLPVILIIVLVGIAIFCFWKRRKDRRHRQVPTDDPDNFALDSSNRSNAQNGDRGQGTMSNAQTGTNLKTYGGPDTTLKTYGDPELNTMSNGINANAWPGDSHNQEEPGQNLPSLGLNAYAWPRDRYSLEGPSQDKLHQKILSQHIDLLMYLDILKVMMYIEQKGILDDVTVRDINEQKTTTEKIKMLIEKLKQKPQEKYEEFKQCLVLAGQEHLKNMLEED